MDDLSFSFRLDQINSHLADIADALERLCEVLEAQAADRGTDDEKEQECE